MTDTNQLPPLPEPEGVIVVGTQALRAFTADQMRAYALQARAQVRGDPVWFHKNWGEYDDIFYRPNDVIPDGSTPLYTTPQPAQATQAEVTGLLEAFDEAVAQELPRVSHVEYDSHKICKHFASKVRDIIALRPVQSGLTGCNCRWDGDTQVQWCELHLAHKEAIHEWSERAKEAEKKLALRPAAVPMTDEQADALATEAFGEYMCDLNDDIELALVRKVETYHHITAQAKKEGA